MRFFSPSVFFTKPFFLINSLIVASAGAVELFNEDFEGSQPFTDAAPAGSWVRGSDVFWESYLGGGGILDRAATDLGDRAVSLNPTPDESWIYRDTGIAFEPNTTYTLTLFAGSRQNSAYQGGGLLEFGLWDGIPTAPATEEALMPEQADGNQADTSTFPAQTMTKVARYSFTTGNDVSGMGQVVIFVRNLASGLGRSTIDQITLEANETLPDRPNILWLVAEDMSPTLGCYGDPNAITPNIDSFAATGQRFEMCWANGPFCSVARTALITGTHATRGGGSMHRASDSLQAPNFMRFYPRLLQEAGYYTSNNSKEDYNLVFPSDQAWRKGWNDSSGSAHWRNAPAGQPFFAVFNLDTTHESRIRPVGGTFQVERIHQPSEMVLPECHPDIPKLRESWASHHDYITQMDREMRQVLDELEADGLAEDTIVFFYADHGSCVPGYKRFVGNRGQRAPLIVHFPEKYRHLAPEAYAPGSSSDELVSFVDFPATLLSLLDCEVPTWMHGRAFAGPRKSEEPDYLAGYICRHDTRYANARSVTDGRYVYIRNYQSDTPHGNWSAYTNGNPSTTPSYATLGGGEWLRDFWRGGLSAKESHFFVNHGYEQLYDLQTDPDETVNLLNDPNYASTLQRLRGYLDDWQLEHRDGGLIVEGQLYDLVTSSGLTPWEVIGNDDLFSYAEVLDTAKRANSGLASDIAILTARLTHPDPSVRLWAIRGLGYHGRSAVRAHQAALVTAASDDNVWIALTADQVLAKHATEPTRGTSIDRLFAVTQQTGVRNGGTVNTALERQIHYAGDLISGLPYLSRSDRSRTSTMNNETYLTAAYRRQIFYWISEEYSHPLAQFRATHGLDKTGGDDFENPSGDGISNLARYAFNLAPNDGDLLQPVPANAMTLSGNRGLPILRKNSATGGFSYQYLRRKSISDPRIRATAQVSSDLQNWNPDVTTEFVESIDATFERVTLEAPATGRGFHRIELTR